MKRLLALSVAWAVCWMCCKGIGPSGLLRAAEEVAMLSAMLTLPEGGANYIATRLHSPEDEDEQIPSVIQPAEEEPPPSQEVSSAVEPVPSAPQQAPPEGVETAPVQTVTLSNTGANLQADGVHINNQTDHHTVNIDGILSSPPAVKIVMDGTPQVLIVHTHATESYLKQDAGYYVKEESTRTTDRSQNVCRVGEAIAQELTAAGIVTLHDTTLHDHPSYSGSYNAAAKTIQSTLEQHPSIQVVIDVHRDAIAGSGDTKVKPTAVIDGKKAAQCMILSGCQEGSVTGFDRWEENLKLTVRLQKALETAYPGLARSMLFTPRRYNMHLTTGSFLVEVGSETNTLEEAVYTGQLIGRALAGVLTQEK